MTQSQIFRFPKKYTELFNNLSNEDSGKLIKAIFNNTPNDLEGLNLVYFNIIKVDLDNLEKSALNGKKGKESGKLGGRPKKKTPQGIEEETPQGIEEETPQVEKIKPLKERESERERESESKDNKEKEDKNKITKEELKQELEKFIEKWNITFKSKRRVTPDIITAYEIKRKKYTKEDFALAFNRYIKTKMDGKVNGEFTYMLEPLSFITQKNGFVKYL